MSQNLPERQRMLAAKAQTGTLQEKQESMRARWAVINREKNAKQRNLQLKARAERLRRKRALRKAEARARDKALKQAVRAGLISDPRPKRRKKRKKRFRLSPQVRYSRRRTIQQRKKRREAKRLAREAKRAAWRENANRFASIRAERANVKAAREAAAAAAKKPSKRERDAAAIFAEAFRLGSEAGRRIEREQIEREQPTLPRSTQTQPKSEFFEGEHGES